MTRLLPALLAGLLCGVAGMRHAGALRAQAARLHRWDALLQRLQLLLQESAYALPDALAMAADGTGLPDQALQTVARGLRTAPREPLSAQVRALALPVPERDVLERMAERLSHGSLEARCLAVEQARAELAPLCEEAGQTVRRDARMWASLGWTVGACVTILLL